MKRILTLLVLAILVSSCRSRKAIVTKKDRNTEVEIVKQPKTEVVKEKELTKPETTPIKVPSSTENYIKQYQAIAIDEMKAYGIPASITLAQGILESGSGKGRLATKANNHFGIKCHNWNGAKIYHDDDKKQECFRKYNNASYSFRDHSEFLTSRKRYADLFKLRKDDYKAWAKGLRKAGYATDKRYPEKLISIIDRYKLYEFDKGILENTTSFNVISHTVAKGDTLYSISKKYNTTVDALQKINRLATTDLSIGQVIKLEDKGNK